MVATAAPEHADVVVHQKDANSTSESGSRQNANFSRRLGVVRVAAILGLLGTRRSRSSNLPVLPGGHAGRPSQTPYRKPCSVDCLRPD